MLLETEVTKDRGIAHEVKAGVNESVKLFIPPPMKAAGKTLSKRKCFQILRITSQGRSIDLYRTKELESVWFSAGVELDPAQWIAQDHHVSCRGRMKGGLYFIGEDICFYGTVPEGTVWHLRQAE